MNILTSPQASLAVGILLMLLGVSFFYKGVCALVKGRIEYWSGFLPLTIISPFLIHLPATKKSLVKPAEGAWVLTIMAPLFFILSFLCTLSGAEYAGLPAVETVNTALRGGNSTVPVISFSKTHGFAFPLFAHSSPALAKVFNSSIGMDAKQEIVPRNEENLQQSLDKNK